MTASAPQIERVPISAFDKVFTASFIDLASSALGGKIIAYSDEFFASAHNLINPLPAIRRPNTFTENGAWYDGWETRRHNESPKGDWVIIRLGVGSGIVVGCEVDTAFFTGNHAPEVTVHGCFAPEAPGIPEAKWDLILHRCECGPSQRHLWLLPEATKKSYTHVKLSMYPDGGIARFRLFGIVVPVFPDKSQTVDLAHVANGGLAVAFSDQHFGKASNLLLPGRGIDMGDGWETRRSRGGDHVDWVVVKLGAEGTIEKAVVDTAHFKGNFPKMVKLEATNSQEARRSPFPPSCGCINFAQLVPSTEWTEILPPQKCGPHKEHIFTSDLVNVDKPYTHVRMTIIPDGGVKRLRIFGKRK